MKKGLLAGFIVDMVAVGASFVLCVGIKPGTNSTYFSSYFDSFVLFLVIWIFSSFAFEKYNFRKAASWQSLITKILICNLFIFFLVTSIMYLFQSFNYSRFIVIGTVGVATLVELTIGSVYFTLLNTRVRYESSGELKLRNAGKLSFKQTSEITVPKKAIPKYDFQLRKEYL